MAAGEPGRPLSDDEYSSSKEPTRDLRKPIIILVLLGVATFVYLLITFPAGIGPCG